MHTPHTMDAMIHVGLCAASFGLMYLFAVVLISFTPPSFNDVLGFADGFADGFTDGFMDGSRDVSIIELNRKHSIHHYSLGSIRSTDMHQVQMHMNRYIDCHKTLRNNHHNNQYLYHGSHELHRILNGTDRQSTRL
eukprot:93933_1